MKLLIDSQPTEVPAHAQTSFSTCCSAILEQLLGRDLSITACTLDGKQVVSAADGEGRFSKTSTLEIQTAPVKGILHDAVSHQCEELEEIERACGELVTESLVGDPEEVLEHWQSFCGRLNEQLKQLPTLCGLLSQTDADDLTTRRLEVLSTTMKACGESLSKADVVTFSDTLELQLLPWLREFRQLVEAALSHLEKIPTPATDLPPKL